MYEKWRKKIPRDCTQSCPQQHLILKDNGINITPKCGQNFRATDSFHKHKQTQGRLPLWELIAKALW